MVNPSHKTKGNKYGFSIRQASQADVDVICAFDDVAQRSSQRRKFIHTIRANTLTGRADLKGPSAQAPCGWVGTSVFYFFECMTKRLW